MPICFEVSGPSLPARWILMRRDSPHVGNGETLIDAQWLDSYEPFLEADDSEGLARFLSDSDLTAKKTELGFLLIDAVESGATRCLREIIKLPLALESAGGEALGAAARDGDLEAVRLLRSCPLDLRQPTWEPDCDWDHLVTGAMLSMEPEIVEIACAPEVISAAGPNWLDEAMEIVMTSESPRRWIGAASLGAGLLAWLESLEPTASWPQAIGRFSRFLERAEGAPESIEETGAALATYSRSDDATLEDVIHRLAFGADFDVALRFLEPAEQLRAHGAEVVVWMARKASTPFEPDPDRGWKQIEDVLDRGVGMDGRDDYGRTALMYAVWKTEGREAMLEKMISLNADLNATAVNTRRVAESVWDFSQKGFAKRSYGELLRRHGAKSAREQ